MATRARHKPPLFYAILSLTLIFLVFGLVMVASASSVVAYNKYGDSFFFLKRQLKYLAMGLVVMAVASKVDYRRLRNLAPISIVLSSAALFLVLIPSLGRAAGGASRWVEIGGFTVQPSEFAKLAVILYTADLLTRRKQKVNTLRELIKPLGIPLGLMFALIMLQPDLGTALVITGSVFSMLFLTGIKVGELALLSFGGASGVFYLIMSEGYRRARFLAFLDPWADPRKNGFHIIQSLLAFGSGGLRGVGLGLSRQKFGYLPAPHTDFILAVIGEELGLFGALATVLLFILLAVVVMRVIRRCDDPFGKLLAGGIGSMMLVQAIINMGSVTGMLPITGVPLPFVSSGGSSLILALACIGVLLNITTQTRKRKLGVSRESHDMRGRHGRPRVPRVGAGRSA